MTTHLQPGQYADRYRIVRLLGSGGMAEVWEVAAPGHAERLALKVSRNQRAEDARRLLREGRAAAALDHPNLLPVLVVVPVEGGVGLVLPLVEGPALDLVVKRARPSEDEALVLFRDIVRGVAHAHSLGMVHRDLKPGNVLLDLTSGAVVPRVSDFGLVKLEEPGGDHTRTGAVFGTPAYAAPEQLRDSASVDERADLWSLGVLFVELLTGPRPYAGRGVVALCEAHARGPDLSGLAPEHGALASRMLQVAPQDRIRTCEALLRALDPLVPLATLGTESGLFRSAASLAARGDDTQAPLSLEAAGAPRPIPRHLPPERDAFVGREAELRALEGLLRDGARLVTVLGMGGVGKTRAAVRYGWTRLADWPGGVFFCDLSEARSAEGVAFAVAQALDVPLGRDPIQQLGHAIAGHGRCLVVLDNFEQVAGCAAETLGRWLDRAHDARFVVTSRERLGLPGEVALDLDPLPTADAVDLFLARARDAQRFQSLTPDELADIEPLVILLDGLPLATELAAGRLRAMSPRAILDRMTERFKLLASSGGRHPRQATLRASLDWSWDLLSPDEQAALAQLSVFEGGFTLDAAEAVLALDALWPADAVAALVEKSLVRRLDQERYGLLVSVHAYAAEKLEVLGSRAATEVRHGEWCAGFWTNNAPDALHIHGGVAHRQALLVELENVVAACRRAVARGDGSVAAATGRAAFGGLEVRGPDTRAVELSASVLGLSDLAASDRVTMEDRLGQALWLSGRMDEARGHFDAALTVARQVGDRPNECKVLGNLAQVYSRQGRMGEAYRGFVAALSVCREVGGRVDEATVLSNMGTWHRSQARFDEARIHFDAALAIQREVGDRSGEGSTLCNIGILHGTLGQMDEAQAYFDAALAAHREVGDRKRAAVLLGNLGTLHRKSGRRREAQTHFDAALTAARELGDRRGEGYVLGELGALYHDQGRSDDARAHLDAALAVHRETGEAQHEGVVLGTLGALHANARRIDEALACLDAGAALLRSVGDTVEVGKLLCYRAEALVCTRPAVDATAARAALTEAEHIAAQCGAGPDSELGHQIANARAALAALDD